MTGFNPGLESKSAFSAPGRLLSHKLTAMSEAGLALTAKPYYYFNCFPSENAFPTFSPTFK